MDRMWTAHDVCETLIHRCGHIKDKNWVLIESLESLSFGKYITELLEQGFHTIVIQLAMSSRLMSVLVHVQFE